jgi:hypothetical protein
MKNAAFFFILFFGLLHGCKKQDPSQLLTGKWVWIQSLTNDPRFVICTIAATGEQTLYFSSPTNIKDCMGYPHCFETTYQTQNDSLFYSDPVSQYSSRSKFYFKNDTLILSGEYASSYYKKN